MRRFRFPLVAAVAAVAASASLVAPAGVQAAIPLGKMEHSIRVAIVERTGKAASVTREEAWIAEDRSRLIAYDPSGALRAETVYAPEGTFTYQPGGVPIRWPMTTMPGMQPLDERARASCGIGQPGTRKLPASRRLGRAVDVHRTVARSPRMSATTTCWIDRRTRQLLESRDVIRGPGSTTVVTLRVELVEIVPRDAARLAPSPEAAALAGQAMPLPSPPLR